MPTAGPRGGEGHRRRCGVPRDTVAGPWGLVGNGAPPPPTSTLLDISVLTPNRPSGRAARSPERSHAAGRPRPQQETNPNRGGPMGPDGAPGSCDPGNECSKLGETRSAPPREPALAPPGGDAQEGRVRGPTRRPVQPPLSRGASAGAGAAALRGPSLGKWAERKVCCQRRGDRGTQKGQRLRQDEEPVPGAGGLRPRSRDGLRALGRGAPPPPRSSGTGTFLCFSRPPWEPAAGAGSKDLRVPLQAWEGPSPTLHLSRALSLLGVSGMSPWGRDREGSLWSLLCASSVEQEPGPRIPEGGSGARGGRRGSEQHQAVSGHSPPRPWGRHQTRSFAATMEPDLTEQGLRALLSRAEDRSPCLAGHTDSVPTPRFRHQTRHPWGMAGCQ